MLTQHTSKYMIHYSDLYSYIDWFVGCEYYCFDTETCCTSLEVYNDYYINKTKCLIKGDHAKVYAWALSNTSNDYVLYGETLEQFLTTLNNLFDYILDDVKILIKGIMSLRE